MARRGVRYDERGRIDVAGDAEWRRGGIYSARSGGCVGEEADEFEREDLDGRRELFSALGSGAAAGWGRNVGGDWGWERSAAVVMYVGGYGVSYYYSAMLTRTTEAF